MLTRPKTVSLTFCNSIVPLRQSPRFKRQIPRFAIRTIDNFHRQHDFALYIFVTQQASLGSSMANSGAEARSVVKRRNCRITKVVIRQAKADKLRFPNRY